MTRQPVDRALSGPFLPESTRRLLQGDTAFPARRRHPGLQLDKFSGISLTDKGVMELQKEALIQVTETYGDKRLLLELNRRRTSMLETVHAHTMNMVTAGPLTLHLSRAGTWENAGICLHPVYGFVHLPGSGLKGLVRSWAETVWAPAQEDQEAAWRRIEELFGFSPHSEGHKFPRERQGLPGWRPASVRPQSGSSVGRMVFHDAWPEEWPRLEVDVANNHHVKYYDGKEAPGDWEDPNLVYFLSIGEGVRFNFAISDRVQRGDDALKLVEGWLRGALQVEGAGAKTAAGYGRFVAASGERLEALPTLCSREYKLELITPAFLAGADQGRDDCNLRGATLKGLLRWWWRIMYAGKVDRKTLRTLESAVWGDTEQGSPVRLAVRLTAGEQPKKFSKDPQLLREHGIVPDRGSRTVLGLYYASYGMAEKTRWYRPAGCQWQVVITARNGSYRLADKQHLVLDAETLICQASAALWLFARYGGAGSKARKGFGSFRDVPVSDLASIEDCHRVATEFLEYCRIPFRPGEHCYSPALEHAQTLPDAVTRWDVPLHACHQVGKVLQYATKALDKAERGGLGLPRRGARIKLSRHASPVHWGLTRGDDERIVVRLIAFPSAKLPSWESSIEILKSFRDEARRELSRCKNKAPVGVRYNPSSPPPVDLSSSAGRKVFPEKGKRYDVVLLEEKTKKGGWKARHPESGLSGPVQDSTEEEVIAGQTVNLFVQSVNVERNQISFRWKEQGKKKKITSQARRSTGRRRTKRGRRR